ncbi:MAG: RnfH family protein [Cardiobacteriaceae bacterium]|nr:RnfH family protein [Cardiobacteriaceae bacterium]
MVNDASLVDKALLSRKMITVEVVYGEATLQKILTLKMYEGATLWQAVERSGIVRFFPHLDFNKLDYGIWGQGKRKDEVLRDGDRVEIYRPLIADPKEMRRQRAKKRE